MPVKATPAPQASESEVATTTPADAPAVESAASIVQPAERTINKHVDLNDGYCAAMTLAKELKRVN